MARILFVLLLTVSPLGAQTLSGPIRVIDADTIDVGASVNVRLLGIDAAEDAQTCTDTGGGVLACGAMATAAAHDIYAGRHATCAVDAFDRYGRALATCSVDGRDMGRDLVASGIAQVYRDDPRYASEEAAARRAGHGLWAYAMLRPAAWRAAEREARTVEPAPRPAVGGCGIKGNISSGGYIYHLPGMRDYDRTTIREDRGERWFCTEDEARASGWRRAKR